MKCLIQLLFWMIVYSHSILSAQQFKFEWARSFGGSKDEIDRIMKVDKKGDLYLFCEVYSSHFSIDNKFFFNWINPENYPSNAVLLKYSPSGELLWGRALKTNNIGIEAYGIVIDHNNNIILSGLHQGNEFYLDSVKIYSSVNIDKFAFILKLDEEGKLLKYQTFAETISGGFNNGGGIAIDQSGHYYMTAKTRYSIIDKNKDTIFNSDLTKGRYLLLFKLDQDFNPIWIKKYYNVDGYFGDVKVDGEDNIIVYGMFRGRELTVDSFTVHNAETDYLQGDFGQSEIYLLKVNPNGQAIWLKSVLGKDVEACSKNDLTCDKDNNIYLGGLMGSDTVVFNERISLNKDRRQLNYWDIFYAKYDKDGNCIWARPIINGIDPIDDMSIQILPSGHLIVSGNFSNQDLYAGNKKLGSIGQSDCFVLLTGNSGEIITGFSYGGAKNEYDKQLTSNGKDLYVLCNFGSDHLEFNNTIIYNDTTDGSSDAILIKYSLDSLVSTNDVASKEISINIFPNPATTSIYLQLPENFEMELCYYNIYSITGDFIASGIMQSTNAEINLNSLPSGEYVLSGGNLKGNKFSGKFTVIR